MKKLDLGQSIGILANVGVIAGIVFLGLELRQHNELMEAEASMATHQGGQEFAMSLAQNPALTSVLAKVSLDVSHYANSQIIDTLVLELKEG